MKTMEDRMWPLVRPLTYGIFKKAAHLKHMCEIQCQMVRKWMQIMCRGRVSESIEKYEYLGRH